MHDAALYDYELPPEVIAQEPLADRDAARLLVVDRAGGGVAHRGIRDLPGMLEPGDLLVVNDTRVVPARLVGRRERTGGRWEGLFLRVDEEGHWVLVVRTRGRPATGERIVVLDRDGADGLLLEVIGRSGGGSWRLRPLAAGSAFEILARVGRVPLPGYIRGGVERPDDVDRYQTVFARASGAAAAPTAGLHFTPRLLDELAARGVERASVTLHVGLDTVRPITTERIDDHPMHTEWCQVPQATATAIAAARARGGRVVAVGTTVVRTLETAAAADSGPLSAWEGSTSLFIRPGFHFRAVDCLLTNFHMPRTTLMVLVSAFASREAILAAYAEAIRARYRFLSYGDAMFLTARGRGG